MFSLLARLRAAVLLPDPAVPSIVIIIGVLKNIKCVILLPIELARYRALSDTPHIYANSTVRIITIS
jgi:hypothetical protein